MTLLPKRGDIYVADLGQGVGSEQANERPVVIVQNNKGNAYADTTIIVPITSRMKNDMKIDLSNSRKNYYDNQMYYKTTLKNTYSFNNYINKNNDITNFAKTTYKTNKIEKNEIEEQKQSSSIEDVNLSKSFNNNTNYNPHINGRFNNFFRQYSSNTLAEEISNPILYKFFNYKKNKYELDKSLGKFSMP